jgi:hypothetical protein
VDLAEAAAHAESRRTNWQPPSVNIPVASGGKPTAINYPVPARKSGPWQLPATAKVPDVPKPVKKVFYKGLEIGWNGVKWVARNPHKAVWHGLNWYSNIGLAIDLAKWASGQLPGYKPPPRVETKYDFSGPQTGLKYRHFDNSLQPFPPPGYDRFGNLEK